MNDQLVAIATELLQAAGPAGALTDHFWKDLITHAGHLAPIEVDDREALLLAMDAEIQRIDGKNRVVFTNGQSK